MNTLFGFLLASVSPLVMRALITIGFTAISFTAVRAVVDQLTQQAQSSWSVLPATVLQLASLAGIPEALGMIFGAFTARLTLWMAINATKMIYTGAT